MQATDEAKRLALSERIALTTRTTAIPEHGEPAVARLWPATTRH
jgi:hypothetical protein